MQDENNLIFPKTADQARLSNYLHYDKIYFGDHFDAFSIKAERQFTVQYARLRYVVANFGGLISRVMADMLFGEALTLDVQDKNLQTFIDGFQEDNQFFAQLYESALGNSRRGDACFKLRIGPRTALPDSPPSLIVEEFTPATYFPVLDQTMPRNTPRQDVIAIQFRSNSKTYLRKEIHEPGSIYQEIYEYDPQQYKIISQLAPTTVAEMGFKEREDTGINRSLVFHIPNVRDGTGFFGTSDYRELDSLFYALNNRITKVDNILDKHSDPILAVPPGVIDGEGKVKKEALGLFEVDNDNPGFNKPEYIVWNANLDSAFSQIEKLVDLLFMVSEIAPASVGKSQDGGQAESGRALKFKLLATIRKRNRKMRYYDQGIKDILETAQEFAIANNVKIDGVVPSKVERPTIKWGDGVINDTTEEVTNWTARIDGGFGSRADAISDLDGVTPDEAKKKVKEIDSESAPNLPAISNNLSGGGTGQPSNPAAPVGPQPPQSTNRQEPVPQNAGR